MYVADAYDLLVYDLDGNELSPLTPVELPSDYFSNYYLDVAVNQNGVYAVGFGSKFDGNFFQSIHAVTHLAADGTFLSIFGDDEIGSSSRISASATATFIYQMDILFAPSTPREVPLVLLVDLR